MFTEFESQISHLNKLCDLAAPSKPKLKLKLPPSSPGLAKWAGSTAPQKLGAPVTTAAATMNTANPAAVENTTGTRLREGLGSLDLGTRSTMPRGEAASLGSVIRSIIRVAVVSLVRLRSLGKWKWDGVNIGIGWAAGGQRSSSYYKRSPRSGYMARIYSKLRRLLRDLLYYFKKHPMKVFMLVIMPLITGGALTGLLAKFGIRLPGGIEKMFGAAAGGSNGGGYGVGRGQGGHMQFERTKVEGPLGGLGEGIGSVVGGLGGIGGAVSLAKMFM